MTTAYVEAVNCAGRGVKAHLSFNYKELVVQGMYVSRRMASASKTIPMFVHKEMGVHMIKWKNRSTCQHMLSS